MKRLITLAIMVAFILGTVGMAQAIQLNAKGDWQVSGNYVKNPNFDSDAKDDPFKAMTRVRLAFEFIANENLKGVFRVNTGDLKWGGISDSAGNLDIGNRVNLQYDQAYLDFMVPNTQINIRGGLTPTALPNNLGSWILDDNIWTVAATIPFTEMIGLTFGWGRLQDNDDGGAGDYSKDEVDMFYAIVPITMDGIQVNPFAAYARAGRNAFENIVVNADPKSSNHYWVGVSAAVSILDPIVIVGDFNFGGNSRVGNTAAGNSIGEARGWTAAGGVQFKMPMLTPMLFGLYESGESRSSAGVGNRSKIMPTLSPDLGGVSSFGFGGSNFRGNTRYALGLNGPTGKWGVGLKLLDITFVENLSHVANFAYYQGTNDQRVADATGNLGTSDKAYEINFDTTYKLYEELAAIVELGWIKADLKNFSTDDAWKAAVGLRYRF